MLSNMITEHEEDVEFSVNYDYEDQFRDQLFIQEESDCSKEEADIYQQLAEKDHYLLLAAEAGKVLLEKNQELTSHYQNLESEYSCKIEQLEQERYHLRKELCERENTYESHMQDLQQELSGLSGQLQMVQKSSKSFEKSHQSTFNDLAYQNNSLLKELDEVKNYNQDLAQQVQTLSKRIDGRVQSRSDSKSMPLSIEDDTPMEDASVDYLEMKSLKEQVQKLAQHKDRLEESLTSLAHEKQSITQDQVKTVGKVSTLEYELLELKQQIVMCQEDLGKTKKNNVQLKDQLEEYVMMQQSSQNGLSGLNNSLFSELEMSLSEADMNFHNLKRSSSNDDEHHLPHIKISPIADPTDLETLKRELKEVYIKLRSLRDKLFEDHHFSDEEKEPDIDAVDGTVLIKLVDHIIELIKERVLSLGLIDARSASPIHLDLDNSDNLSQADSQTSDHDVDILEQQVHDLNQRLNITTSELEKTKKGLVKSQAVAQDEEEKALSLTVRVNSQEREIEALRKERDIIMADTTMEEKLKQALQERDEALRRENELKAKYEVTRNDMQKLNNQLIAAVEQKLELSEQLEQWQFDMASLIDQQLATKIKKEQQRSRKRTSTTNPARMFAAKFFAGRNSSREASQTSTPSSKSPVPPRS